MAVFPTAPSGIGLAYVLRWLVQMYMQKELRYAHVSANESGTDS
jgi:hypothetical protein